MTMVEHHREGVNPSSYSPFTKELKGGKRKLMANDEVNNSEKIVVGMIMVAILGAMLLLIVAIVYDATGDAYDSFAGNTYDYHTVTNESGAYVNTTGYTLSGYNSTWESMSVTAVWANISLTPYLVPSANYTLSAVGVLTNNTLVPNATEYNDANVSYTYQIDTTAESSINVAYDDIQDDVMDMVGNFFELAPTIGTILAVVILIGVIVLLVMYVSRMRNPSSSEAMFSG